MDGWAHGWMDKRVKISNDDKNSLNREMIMYQRIWDGNTTNNI